MQVRTGQWIARYPSGYDAELNAAKTEGGLLLPLISITILIISWQQVSANSKTDLFPLQTVPWLFAINRNWSLSARQTFISVQALYQLISMTNLSVRNLVFLLVCAILIIPPVSSITLSPVLHLPEHLQSQTGTRYLFMALLPVILPTVYKSGCSGTIMKKFHRFTQMQITHTSSNLNPPTRKILHPASIMSLSSTR